MGCGLALYSSVNSSAGRADAAANGGADESALRGREHDSTNSGADSITFDAALNGTIRLDGGDGAGGTTGGTLSITEALTIDGDGRITISGDVNSDGRKDLAVSNGSLLNVFLGDGTGGFGQPTPFSLPFGLQFELADFNRDGRLDVASALNQGNGVAVLLNGCNQPAGDLMVTASDRGLSRAPPHTAHGTSRM